MSSEIMLGKLDRGLRGSAVATYHPGPVPYVAIRHQERDGREGGRLVVKLEEIDAVVSLLSKAKAIGSGSKAQHRTVRATQEELELDRKLF